MRTDDPTPPSSSDTVIVVKKDLKRVQTPGEAKDEYVLPDWFLSRNVKGKAELDILQHVCRIAICGDEETMQEKDINNTDRKPAPGAENSKYRESTSPTESLSSDMAEDATKLDERNVIADFQISFNAFAELRDVTAAALVRNQLGKLPVSNPSILLRWSKTDETQYVESVLAHLAKDLQATLIAVDLEDLEDLGWEFDHQERGWTVNEIRDDPNNQTKLREEEEPDRNLAMGMTLHYLSARSKPHASEETWKRTMKAIGAILNAQSAKPQEQQSNSPETPVTNSGGSVDNDQPPLLLHVRDFSDMMRMSRGHRFLARLRDAVQEQRMFGRSVVLLVSLFRSSTCNKGGCQCNSCRKDDYRDQTRISKKISAGWASTVTITINSLSDKAEKIENERSDKRDNKKDNTNEVAQINIKRLKRFLRWRIPHLFLPEVLEALQPHQPFSSWQKHGFDAEYESMGVSQWSEEDLQRSVIQITGRAFGKSHLNLSDVRAVLSRLGLCEGFNKKPKGEKGEEKEGTRKEKLDKIRSDANEFETKLLSCIINPGKVFLILPLYILISVNDSQTISESPMMT
jgi:hypothetical protein